MKKYALSALAAALMSGVIHADTMTLFTDQKTGQVFTTPGEGRVEMGDFVDAKSVDMGLRENASSLAEYQDAMKKYTPVSSKSKKLEFSGLHYFGWTYAQPTTIAGGANSAGFESRRNYIQAVGYFNDKDYFRVTLDATKELGSDAGTDAKTKGYAEVFVKYAYLYLDNILPFTGAEIGIVHRPWIDYEEHNSWNYRSISKVLIEPKATKTEAGVDLVNSADFGVNFKTKTDNFSSEIGVFNGEGYHADKTAANQKNSTHLSGEWRLTAHLIGSGTKVGKYDRTKDTYLHLSTYGLVSKNHKDNDLSVGDAAEYDRSFYGIHAVYNQPEFLISSQYLKDSDDVRATVTGTSTQKTKWTAWSANAEYRPMTDWTLIARYDDYEKEIVTGAGNTSLSVKGKQTLGGIAYKYNKNVTFIASGKHINEANASGVDTGNSKNVYMLTTEVKW